MITVSCYKNYKTTITTNYFQSGILVMCFCKKKPPKSQCPVRPMTMSMREAQVSDVGPDSTRTAMDNQKKSKKKKSKEPAKKKKKSADSSQKVSKKKKKSSKSKKSAEKKKPEVVAPMDPDVKSTQRSAERSEQPDQTAQTKTAKSGKDMAPAQTPAQDRKLCRRLQTTIRFFRRSPPIPACRASNGTWYQIDGGILELNLINEISDSL
ncbi:uncharacterized protein CELE_F46A8.6 [Caenorhabditis elegans]|uniref:Uncharacterized protein n=1 Tax=Caenorhabditis elegans TaxID=6239 RepID=O01332_CAEEL|nr:Uncharacterized protein CELE_F46A8.6 [Caenorhabditis elegans]CAB04392.2 Uncharacterized protein CELE_F46A8.6 [Caenorhabditis elegans]|eukprot:NP_492886.2 Uncharacterized protein CELE_F46A8.6 [Caenorhabditis elegans]